MSARHYKATMRSYIAQCVWLAAGLCLSTPTRAQVSTSSSTLASTSETPAQSPDTRDIVGVHDLPQTGFHWGLGVGFALPFGSADGGASLFANTADGTQPFVTRDGSMSGIISYRVPLALDLGYRVSPTWWLGLRPEVATGGKGDQCPTDASCHFTDARVSAFLKYYLDPQSGLNPWLGVGLGWEWLRSTLSVAIPEQAGVKQTLSGPLLQAFGGLSFDFGDHIHAGPYATAAVGRYVWNGLECTAQLGCPGSYFVRDGAFHAWASIGIAGDYGP